MTATGWVAVAVVVVLLVLLLVWLWSRERRRAELKQRFGPEYDRAVTRTGSESSAARELSRREARLEALDIHPLDPAQRERYAQLWDRLQAQFVDDPVAALGGADRLVQRVMVERGYPTGDFEQRAADLSVRHADVLDHYRAAHAVDISPRTSTETMREAMVHYRTLFAALLDDDEARAADSAARGPR